MKRFAGFTLTIVASILAPQFAGAHFKLLEPASWIEENQLGDPQKLGPCGGTSANAKGPANPGKASGIVTEAKGGTMMHIKVQETVYHPGFYRVALAVNSRTELPADPEVKTRDSAKGPQSVSAAIQYPPQPPVLADGLWQHNGKMANPVMETDVPLPNINCAKCTLQIVQFMAEHGKNADGDYTYHHCSEIKITADPSKPIDTRWPGQQ
jgi:hypothetical protein